MKTPCLFLLVTLPAGCGSPTTGSKPVRSQPPVSAPAAAPAPVAPDLIWSDFMPHSAAFRAELPGEVNEQQSTRHTSAGTALVVKYFVGLEGSVFGVMLTSYPPGVLDRSFPQQIISAARDASLAGTDPTILKEEKNEYVDRANPDRVFPGRLVIAETAGLLMKSQWYVVGDTLYQILQTSPAEQPFDGVFERMARSFRLSSQ
jgi:hypothetical protein